MDLSVPTLPTTSKRSILRNGSSTSSQLSVALKAAQRKKHVHFGISLKNNFSGLVSIVKAIKIWNKKKGSNASLEANENELSSPAPLTEIQPLKEVMSFKKLKTVIVDFFTQVIDPSKKFYYIWLIIISLAVMYNYVFIIGRSAFELLQNASLATWLTLDYLCDFIYLLDIGVRFRTGYLENGLLVDDWHKIAKDYTKKLEFYFIDILCFLPFDLIANAADSSINFFPLLRFNRFLKVTRLLEFRQKTETLTNYPNIFRITSLLVITLLITHWNACFYFFLSKQIGFNADSFVFQNDTVQRNEFLGQYTKCFFWSTLALTTISNFNNAVAPIEMIYVSISYLIGILIFATTVGNVTAILANLGAQKSSFQQKVDSIKSYMQMRKVNKSLQKRVLKWFNYSWTTTRGANDDELIKKLLPINLQADLSVNIHLETLKRVHIFQDCEPGLLQELVLKLKLEMFSPSDYVCRKGDIGREMYFIKRGKLSVVSDDGKTIFANLSEGSYFGEISILDIPGSKAGNRRTANVVSVGFSDLFCLTKNDLWQVLSEYPLAKRALLEKGKQLLRKDNLLDENLAEETEKIEMLNNSLNEKFDCLKFAVNYVETRLARLIGEHEANMSKIKARTDSLQINTKFPIK